VDTVTAVDYHTALEPCGQQLEPGFQKFSSALNNQVQFEYGTRNYLVF